MNFRDLFTFYVGTEVLGTDGYAIDKHMPIFYEAYNFVALVTYSFKENINDGVTALDFFPYKDLVNEFDEHRKRLFEVSHQHKIVKYEDDLYKWNQRSEAKNKVVSTCPNCRATWDII